MQFDDLAQALDTAVARGAEYADVRFEEAHNERIEVRNGVVAGLSDETSRGYGIRVLIDGAGALRQVRIARKAARIALQAWR